MNKLKENAFTIAVVAVALVMAALAYLLVVQPFLELKKTQAQIEAKKSELEKLNSPKKKWLETEDYIEHLKKKTENVEAAFKEGVSFYDEQTKAFHLFFDGVQVQPLQDVFVNRYTDEIRKLVDDYRTKFKITVDPQDPEKAPPTIVKMADIPEAQIPLAMKEFWVIKEVFDAVNALELGGLKTIDFPQRLLEQKDPHPYYRLVNTVVTVELPFSKLEDLLTHLLGSKTVPFILQELSFTKNDTLVGQYLSLEKTQEFKSQAEGDAASYDAANPEPVVVATLKLSAIDWKGVPEEKKKESSEEGPEKKPER